MIYRDEPKLPCPRCKTELVGLDICRCRCGVWVSAFAAPHVLLAEELATTPTISWWRMREPCPLCGDKMKLRGLHDAGLFQGCAIHGYWIDADTVEHTGLARGIDTAKLARLREDPSVVEAVEAQTQRLAAERAARLNEIYERERMLAAHAEERRQLAEEQRRQELERERRRLADERGQPKLEEQLAARLGQVLGHEVATLLLDRIATLEVQNARLERRVADLERWRPGE